MLCDQNYDASLRLHSWAGDTDLNTHRLDIFSSKECDPGGSVEVMERVSR